MARTEKKLTQANKQRSDSDEEDEGLEDDLEEDEDVVAPSAKKRRNAFIDDAAEEEDDDEVGISPTVTFNCIFFQYNGPRSLLVQMCAGVYLSLCNGPNV